MELNNPDRFSIFGIESRDTGNDRFQFGDKVSCEAIYITKHPHNDLHIINVKMYSDVKTEGIDLLVGDNVLRKISENK